MKQKDYTKNKKYQEWLKGTKRSLSEKELKAIETLVNREVDLLLNLSVKDRFLYLKRDEIKRWHPTQATKDILWVERNIFKSQGKSDFRRISPELVEVSDDFFMETKNIWGESFLISTKNKDSHKIHWDILRTLVSSAPNDGTVGRAIRFLVIDKSTRKYLGVICISSAMYRTKPIHQEI